MSNFTDGGVGTLPKPQSLLFDEKKEAEIRAFFETRFGGQISESKSIQDSIATFANDNDCTFSDLHAIGTERLFKPDEYEEYCEARDHILFRGDDIRNEALQVSKAQKRFAAQVVLLTPPETMKDFEALLRKNGFSNRKAAKIAAGGFKDK